jgi:hypothetical protein
MAILGLLFTSLVVANKAIDTAERFRVFRRRRERRKKGKDD